MAARRHVVVIGAALLTACAGASDDDVDAFAGFDAAERVDVSHGVDAFDASSPEAAAPADALSADAPPRARPCAFAMPNPSATRLPRAASYEVDAAGLVHDHVTGRQWQRDALPGRPSQPEAAAACEALVLGGHDDWRLPTRLELVSLVDYTRNFPSIDVAAFPGTEADFYWSSTLVADYPDRAWYVGFAYGFVFTKPLDAPALARCVRDEVPPVCAPQRFAVEDDGVVRDADTGLRWQRKPLDGRLSFDDANAACAARGDGWRLPSMKELQTLIDDARIDGPRFDAAAFPDVPADFYWTSSPIQGVENHAWYVNFLFGNPDYDGMPERNVALCVR